MSDTIPLNSPASVVGHEAADPLNWKTVKVRDCPSGKCPVVLSYQTLGVATNPAVLLVMGLNSQGIAWGDGFCQQIASAGFYVIRFDNRDCGFSTKFDHLKCAPMWHLLFPKCLMKWKAPYSLKDMAEDACGLLTALNIEKAHWFGQSMGGMITQTAAIHFPHRLASMVTLMSTTGNQNLPQPSLGVQLWFLKTPKSRATGDVINHKINHVKAVFCTGITIGETEENFIREDLTAQAERSTYELGATRHLFAIQCAPCRDAALGQLEMPTMVLHGQNDILIPVKHGEHTAAAIAKNRSLEELGKHKGLKRVSGMGHYIGSWRYDALCAELFPFWQEVDISRFAK